MKTTGKYTITGTGKQYEVPESAISEGVDNSVKTTFFQITKHFFISMVLPTKNISGQERSFSGMSAEDIALGARVRYPKTGTTGKILHMEQIRGETFAELDSTHLLYRIDQLTPVTGTGKNRLNNCRRCQKSDCT